MHFDELPRAARNAVKVVVALMVLGLAGIAFYSCVLNSPSRIADRAFEDALARAKRSKPEEALRVLDGVLAGEHRAHVKSELEERVGAEIVRITASLVPEPVTRRELDQIGRLVRRYNALTTTAREGAARDILLSTIDRWAAALVGPDDQEAKLVLLRHAASVTDAARSAAYSQRIAATRAAAGVARAQRSPIDALDILLGVPRDAACITNASRILAGLVESPSLLVDAAGAVEQWVAATPETDPLRKTVADALARGIAGRQAADAAEIAALPALLAEAPWNQHAAVKLARSEIETGSTSAADARLRALGPATHLIREARQLRAELALRNDDLLVADELFSGLLESRLLPFQEASQALDRAVLALQSRFEAQLQSGNIPDDLANKVQGASEAQQQALVLEYFKTLVDTDPDVKRAQEALRPLQDVVQLSISAGMTKIRRAQAAGGEARDALLAEAERTFLAIRLQAEGQPVFHLGLGEVYARLGKTAESEAELARVLEMKDPSLSLQVAHVYRGIGSVERARDVATSVFDTAPAPAKSEAAVLMSLLTAEQEQEHEQWLRKADANSPYVKTALLELEARRLLRQGKHAECDRAYAKIAQAHLAGATAEAVSGYNNAALAHHGRFMCTGDLQALRDAESTLELAYRVAADNSIVVNNFATLLENNALIRTVAKHVDVRKLRPASDEAELLIDVLIEGPEREAILAQLAADVGWRRSATLYAQAEVLAPNRSASYSAQLARAQRARDERKARALLERMRQVKALDVSSITAAFEDWTSGKADAELVERSRATVTRYADVLANAKLDAKTRAAALVISASVAHRLGVYWDGADAIVKARTAREEAARLWPAVVSTKVAPAALVDEIASGLDAKRWAELRRRRDPAAALAKLAADRDALATTITSSSQWKQVAALLRNVTERPGLGEIRLARVIADPELEARFKTVFDDPLVRLALESARTMLPANESGKEDLEYFGKR